MPQIKKRAALVINTDPHDKEGSHWLAMYIQDEKTIEFFDSYGLPPSVYEPHISHYVKLFPNVISNEISLQASHQMFADNIAFSIFLKDVQDIR
ncbi:uncharacterized protein NPIL_535271 [Nephila pilipes]|uniref:Ubiquitin-like protease family profile domain-containing protein n=1 Tax=Nephila pilipes TaxID=299642 RepID=A0A8X6PHT0_NEPPI|nr:uncharacterized protein NPIL_535271 [Nephila pilipes]